MPPPRCSSDWSRRLDSEKENRVETEDDEDEREGRVLFVPKHDHVGRTGWMDVDGFRKEPVGFPFISILNRYGSLHVGWVVARRW